MRRLAAAALLLSVLLLGAAHAPVAPSSLSLADWLTRLKVEPTHVAALEQAGYGSLQKLASLPKPEPVLKKAGLGLKVRKRVAKALAAFNAENVAGGGGGTMPAEVGRAHSLYSEGRLPEAAAAMRGAIAASPSDARLYINLGSILIGTTGQKTEAIAAFRSSLELDPTQTQLRSQLVDLLASSGRAAEATDLMSGSSGGGSQDLPSVLAAASAHRKLGNTADALVAYQSAMAMTKDKPADANKVRLAVANFQLQVGNTSAALQQLEDCRSRGYETGGVRILEAEALIRLDRVAEAEAGLRWVLEGVKAAEKRDGNVVWSDDYDGDEQAEIVAAKRFGMQALATLSKLLVHKMPLAEGAGGAESAELAEMVSVARRNVENAPAWPCEKCEKVEACWQKDRFMATLQLATMLDAAAAHAATRPAEQSEMEVEAVELYAEAEAAGEALLVERKLSPWGSNGDRAAMVAKEHLSVQLREQARPFARAMLTAGGGDASAEWGVAATDAQRRAREKWTRVGDMGGWGGQCDALGLTAAASDAEGGGATEATCTIERRSADSLTAEQFEQEYVALGKPLIITGARESGLFDTWKAKEGWRHGSMLNQHAETEVTVAKSSDIVSLQSKGENAWQDKLFTMSLTDYIRTHMGQGAGSKTAEEESNPMYLFRNVPLPQLSSYYEHPSYFTNRSHFHMVERARDGKALFFLGPANSGAYTHQHTAAWNAVVYGAKRWYLLPPAARHGPDTEMEGGMIEWLRTTKNSLPVKSLECTQYAGELLFIPASWWHGVINLCDTVGVALEVGVAIAKE